VKSTYRFDNVLYIIISWIYLHIWFICDLRYLKFPPINPLNRYRSRWTPGRCHGIYSNLLWRRPMPFCDQSSFTIVRVCTLLFLYLPERSKTMNLFSCYDGDGGRLPNIITEPPPPKYTIIRYIIVRRLVWNGCTIISSSSSLFAVGVYNRTLCARRRCHDRAGARRARWHCRCEPPSQTSKIYIIIIIKR